MTRKRTVFAVGFVLAGLGSFVLAGSSLIAATFRLCFLISGCGALWLAFFLFRRPPDGPREFLRAFGSYFTGTATVIFTLVSLFLLLNLMLDVTLKFKTRLDRRSSIQHFEQFGDRVYQPYADLSLNREEVETLLIETFQRPALYESFTQFRERPISGHFVNVHPAGFRDSKNGAPWPPVSKDLKVFVFGGSTTFGYGVPDGQTIPAYLQRLTGGAGLPRRVAVYNFGAGFYFSTQERILFEKLLLEGLRPNIVIFIDGLNDIGNADGEGYWTQTIRKMMERRIASKDFFLADPGGILENMPIRAPVKRLLNYMSSVFATGVRTNDGPVSLAAATAPAVLDRYAMNQEIIRDIALDFGIRTVFVWQPIPSYGYDLIYDVFQKGISVPGSPEQRALEVVYTLMAKRLEAAPPPPDFLYLANVQKGRAVNFYLDELHYTPAFNAEIAGYIFEHMTQRHLLPEAEH